MAMRDIRRILVFGDGLGGSLVTGAEKQALALCNALRRRQEDLEMQVVRPVPEAQISKLLFRVISWSFLSLASARPKSAATARGLFLSAYHWMSPGQYNLLCGRLEEPQTVVVSAGSLPSALAVAFRSQFPDVVGLVQLLHPRCSLNIEGLDLVIAPEHDRLRFPAHSKWIETKGTITDIAHAISSARQLEMRPAEPRVLVALGGIISSPLGTGKNLPSSLLDDFINRIVLVVGSGSVMITTSRRTPKSIGMLIISRLQSHLGSARVSFYEATSDAVENPYTSYLKSATAIIVTADSVNMISDALALEHVRGEIYTCPLFPVRSARIKNFVSDLIEKGYVRGLENLKSQQSGANSTTNPPRLNELERCADLVEEQLLQRVKPR